ncbi:MAG: hypothetical protein HYU30_05070 [Chloroflexi bacterium]|nr:hypothetical protein [Chloroflexota bacterium]
MKALKAARPTLLCLTGFVLLSPIGWVIYFASSFASGSEDSLLMFWPAFAGSQVIMVFLTGQYAYRAGTKGQPNLDWTLDPLGLAAVVNAGIWVMSLFGFMAFAALFSQMADPQPPLLLAFLWMELIPISYGVFIASVAAISWRFGRPDRASWRKSPWLLGWSFLGFVSSIGLFFLLFYDFLFS